jgi:GT2 family glycosyltransferase/glycosyltransferase involved in cell wall biosynthesis
MTRHPAFEPMGFDPPLSTAEGLHALVSRIQCAATADPTVSVVMCGRDRPDLTLTALKALADRTPPGTLEVIFVDDASEPSTLDLLQKVDGLHLLENEENLGFLLSTNRGIAESHGKYVFLLNNDTEVQEGWLPPLLDAFDDPAVGAVGCRLINPDGTVQEAGVAVWDDAGGYALCHGGDPDDERWLTTREVDYASGAAIMVRGDLLRALGGFDERYAPAFYEDTDLCFEVRKHGLKVVLSPESNVLHHGGQSYGRDGDKGKLPPRGKMHQYANQPIFAAKWARELARDHMPPGAESFRVPFRGRRRPRILVADSWVPAHDRDSGGMRMTWILRLLRDIGCDVTLWATGDEPREQYATMFRREGVEVWTGPRGRRYLRSRPGAYDVAIVSRPDVAAEVIPLVRGTSPRAAVLYDSVDVHFERLRREEEMVGAAGPLGWERMRDIEERVCGQADLVVTVAQRDADEFARAFSGLQLDFRVLSNVLPPWPTSPSPEFDDREGFLFIGGYRHPPNADAAQWFCDEVLPRVRARLDSPVVFLGDGPPPALRALDDDSGFRVPGYVEDVVPYFDSARVFISPLRYGSGVKGKVNQALSAGLPIVATSVSVEGMGVRDAAEALVRDDPDAFADACIRLHEERELWMQLSAGARTKSEDWSLAVMRASLRSLLEDLVPPRQRISLRG